MHKLTAVDHPGPRSRVRRAEALPAHIRDLAYWEGQVRWHRLWLAHNDYHRPILSFLFPRVRPGWRVLDVGAGNGVLALPLEARGCRVTALEPCRGMQGLLREESRRRGLAPRQVEVRPWEDLPLTDVAGYDLILACNSLQVCSSGFEAAFRKLFAGAPRHVCVISEVSWPRLLKPAGTAGYRLSRLRFYRTESSYVYRHLGEVAAHLRHRLRRPPTPGEVADLRRRLVFHQGRWWLPDTARVGIFWWDREDVDRPEEAGYEETGLSLDGAGGSQWRGGRGGGRPREEGPGTLPAAGAGDHREGTAKQH
ncbi:MAG: class I SAM-dependent methyltransferase [Desulfobaccales bacterium]